MKIIDLLNKIANGEEAPKKIKYDGIIWEYDGDYYVSKNNLILEEYCNLTTSLNDEVEIIEEEKKIPEKLDVVLLGQCDNWLQPTIETDEKIRAELNPYVIDIIRENTLEIQHKFNELLDYLKSKGDE